MALDKKENYRDNINLKKPGVDIKYSQHQVEEYMKCARDPVYFAENYMRIVNVDKGLMPFEMWGFQKDMIRLFHENRFAITKCPRQVGKCLQKTTILTLRNKKTNTLVQVSIGDFYESLKKTKNLT